MMRWLFFNWQLPDPISGACGPARAGTFFNRANKQNTPKKRHRGFAFFRDFGTALWFERHSRGFDL